MTIKQKNEINAYSLDKHLCHSLCILKKASLFSYSTSPFKIHDSLIKIWKIY